MTAQPRQRPLRRDAERNRLRILAAARDVFAERGFEATLNHVAIRAGVGIGTVYRRFADKDALIDALFAERLAEVAALATEAASAEDPWNGLVGLLFKTSAMDAEDRGLQEIAVCRGHELVRAQRDAITMIVKSLVARAQELGRLRPDVTASDVLIVKVMIGAIADMSRESAPDLYARMLQIVVDGLITARAAPTPLPSAPLRDDQIGGLPAKRRTPAFRFRSSPSSPS